jgi:antitoxin (DNA-binding transcriptional repressor) of toxin-antitoxin stability system
MKSVDLADVTALEPFIRPGSTEPVLVKSHGQTVAAIIPVASTEDVEDLVLSRSPQFEAILKRSQDRLEQEGGLSSEEVRRHLGLSES